MAQTLREDPGLNTVVSPEVSVAPDMVSTLQSVTAGWRQVLSDGPCKCSLLSEKTQPQFVFTW